MRTTSPCFALLVLFALSALPAAAQESPKPKPAANAILIGWDGAHRDHVKALLKDGKLPNLQELSKEGALVDIDVTSGATDTKAGWTQILTGYKPAVTGVYSNARFRDVSEGYSIFERFEQAFGADAMAEVAVIGKRWHCGEIDPPFKRPYAPDKDAPPKPAKKKAKGKQPGAGKEHNRGRVVEESGTKYLVFPGSPYYTMHKSADVWHFGLMKDEKVGDEALAMLDRYGRRPFFFFVHFAEVDHQGHRFGEPAPQYDAAIVSGDRQLGRIVARLKELGVYGKTLVYVTADHGFDVGAKQHRNAPYVFLATNDKQVIRGGTRADIAPTVLERLGVDLSKLTPPLDGEPLCRAATRPAEKPEVVIKGKPRAKAKPGGKRKAKPAPVESP